MKKVIIRKTEEIENWKRNINSEINFIPTMGNLHNGHIKLITTAKNENSNVNLVSIFINPLQFDNKLDLENYPKTCLLYTSPSPRDFLLSRMPSSA